MKSFYRLIGLLVALAVVGSRLTAQSLTTASMSGTVTSSTGEELAGATVRITHVPSGSVYGAVANATGRFIRQDLRVGGPYTVTVEYVGYQKWEATGIFLVLGATKNLPIVLKEEGVALGTVEIAAVKDPIINSGRTGANTTISTEQFQNMPSLNRDISSFTRFTPQASGGGGFGGRPSYGNNYTLDGALLNNAFNLNGNSLPGQEAASAPFSLDALEEASIGIAPYDVRQFGFTGASINLVTRSGSNDFNGSIAWFGQRGNWSRPRVAGQGITLAFAERDQFVARISGPIIKNKLFFSAVFERTAREAPGTTFRPFEAGETGGIVGGNVANVSAADLQTVRDELRRIYNYDPGQFGIFPFLTEDYKVNLRFDYEINQNQKVSLRWNYVNAFDDVAPSNSTIASGFGTSRNSSLSTIPFYSATYRWIEDNNSVSLEWNSTWLGGKLQNQLLVTGTVQRGDQKSNADGDFPMVEIGNPLVPGTLATSFGTEQFRQRNEIDQDQVMIQNNATLFLGRHVVTAGFQYEYYNFRNVFLGARWGRWTFRDFNSFLTNIRNQANGTPVPMSAFPVDVDFRYEFAGRSSDAFVSAARYGFYIQDKWSPFDGFNITAGVRFDIAEHLTTPLRNEQAFAFWGIDTDQLPRPQVIYSPRLGFNWDVFNDGKLQLRGGTGIFSGNIRFVWMTNNVSGTGLQSGRNNPSGSMGITSVPAGFNLAAYQLFNPAIPPTQLLPADLSPGAGTSSINYANNDFNYPTIWRTNIAADYSFGDGWVATAEGAYTQDIYSVFHENRNLRSNPTINRIGNFAGAQTFPYYNTSLAVLTGGAANNARRETTTFNDVTRLATLYEGWSYFVTAQLQKKFSNNFDINIAYTYTDAVAATDNPGAQAFSAWQNNPTLPHLGPNVPFVSTAAGVRPHRFMLAGSYKWKQSKYTSTTFSVFYEIESGGRFSWVYNGDLNNDGSGNNDLMFVPADASQITLIPLATGDTRTSAQLWQQFNAFISQDDYLSGRRGQFVERNGGAFPTVGRMDIGIRQDINWEVAGRPNTFQISLDIINVGNFINENWGVSFINTTRNPLQFVDNFGPDGVLGNADDSPRFRLPYADATNLVPQTRTFAPDVQNIISRYRIQFGLRYIWGR